MSDMIEKIFLVQPEPESAEQQLGLTYEDALALAAESDKPLIADEECLPEYFETDELQQSPESAQLDQLIAAGGSSRIAVIPAVDRVVDPPVVRGPIDVLVGTSRVKNPA